MTRLGMGDAARPAMDPKNPRWETSEVRYQKAKVFWSVLVSVVAAAALTTVFVASCLNRGQVQRETVAGEPSSLTETTGASTTTIIETQPSPPAAAPTTIIVQQPVVAAAPAPTTPTVNSDTSSTEPAPRTTTVRPVQAAPPAVMVAPIIRVPSQPQVPAAGVPPSNSAPSLSPTTSPQGNSTEAAPSPTQGAGPFTTDSPPNAASNFKENPEAGAGAFPGPQ